LGCGSADGRGGTHRNDENVSDGVEQYELGHSRHQRVENVCCSTDI
jgi:hypothetical protein